MDYESKKHRNRAGGLFPAGAPHPGPAAPPVVLGVSGQSSLGQTASFTLSLETRRCTGVLMALVRHEAKTLVYLEHPDGQAPLTPEDLSTSHLWPKHTVGILDLVRCTPRC